MSNWSNAGRVRPVSKGTWSSTVAYTVLDLVTSSDKLRSYIATQNVPAGTPLTNTAYWQVLVDATAINDTANSLMDRLASPFNESGNIVTCHPVEGYSLKTKTLVKPAQSGSGDPSPSNVRPISGHIGAKLTKCGKNLLPTGVSQTTNGVTFTVNTDGSVTVNGTATVDTFFGNPFWNMTFEPAVNYFLSGCPQNNLGLYMAVINGPEDHGSGALIQYTENLDAGVRIIVPNGVTVNNAVFYPQLELGSIATPFEPYQGDTFALDFGQTVYGGTLDWNKGVLTVDMGYAVFNGGENWVVYTYADGRKSFYTVGSGKLSGIADRFINIPGVCSWSPTAEDGCIRDVLRTDVGSTEIEIKPDVLSKWGINDIDTFKARLAANPMQIAYQLATPFTIQLTPARILALKGTNRLYSDCGDTAVFGRIDPEWMNEQLKNAIIALGGNV